MTMRLQLANVTYGELYQFVAAAQAAGVPPEERVRCVGSDEHGDRFEVDLATRSKPLDNAAAAAHHATVVPSAGVNDPATAQGAAAALRKYIRSEGDVDAIIGILGEMRKFFR